MVQQRTIKSIKIGGHTTSCHCDAVCVFNSLMTQTPAYSSAGCTSCVTGTWKECLGSLVVRLWCSGILYVTYCTNNIARFFSVIIFFLNFELWSCQAMAVV
jgi:hypothetical protein